MQGTARLLEHVTLTDLQEEQETAYFDAGHMSGMERFGMEVSNYYISYYYKANTISRIVRTEFAPRLSFLI